MSTVIRETLHLAGQRPTRGGRRRRPADRQYELRRPGQIYRAAIEHSLASMIVIDRLRDEGFSS